jgi:hypothetical protein
MTDHDPNTLHPDPTRNPDGSPVEDQGGVK